MSYTLTKLQEHLKNMSVEEFQKEWNEIKKMEFEDGVSVNDFFKNQYKNQNVAEPTQKKVKKAVKVGKESNLEHHEDENDMDRMDDDDVRY